MFVAGGGINGGVYGCHPNDIFNHPGGNISVPWSPGPTGSMFGVSSRYLKRAIDYRSVLGKLIRDHLGATQNQLNRIIPGYTNAAEKLQSGGTSTIDNTPIIGEPALCGPYSWSAAIAASRTAGCWPIAR